MPADKAQERQEDPSGVERQQAVRQGQGDQHAHEAAVKHALRQLDPHADDAQQDYPTVLRRLQAAIDVELSKWTSAPTQPVGPSGDVAVAEPQKAE